MKGLTERQRETLAWIVAYIQTNWRPPTAEEIAVQFRIARPSAFDMTRALRKKGFLERSDGTPRCFRPRNLAAASAACIDDRLRELVPTSLSISEVRGFGGLVFSGPCRDPVDLLFAVVVRGRVMSDIGILDGDVVVVRRQETVSSGDLAVVSQNTDAMLCRVVVVGDEVRLMLTGTAGAEDGAYVVADADLVVYGKAITMYREFSPGRGRRVIF